MHVVKPHPLAIYQLLYQDPMPLIFHEGGVTYNSVLQALDCSGQRRIAPAFPNQVDNSIMRIVQTVSLY